MIGATHKISWDPSAVARFWNRFNASPGLQWWHFSRQRGAALLGFSKKITPITEPVLDLGCGSGFFIDRILRQGHACCAADVSAEAIRLVNDRFKNNPLFRGGTVIGPEGTIPFGTGSIGTVFLLETVEHLLPEMLDPLFGEISRVLVPGGSLVITAPWRENLEENTLACKACGCAFHKTQHVRSIDEPFLAGTAERAGLKIIFCKPALLLPSPPVWIRAQLEPARVSVSCPECGAVCQSPNRSVFTRLKSLLGELRHLVCVAQKDE